MPCKKKTGSNESQSERNITNEDEDLSDDDEEIDVDEFGDVKGIITYESILVNIFEASEQVKFSKSGDLITSGKISLKYFFRSK